MFNFKSLALITIAILGLAANVQACKNCRLLVYGPTEQTKEVVLYARKNADVLLKEYEAVVNDPKTVDRIKAKALDLVDTAYKAIAHITKAKRTPEEILMDKDAITCFETLFTKVFDFHGFLDTIYPTTQAPMLNALVHKMVTEPADYFKGILKHVQSIPKKEIAAQLSPKFQDLRKACIGLEQERPTVSKIIDIFLNSFVIGNKALLLELGQALHGILKDDAFFAEIEKNQPNHKLPQTASVSKLQEVLRASELQVVTFMKIVSATSKNTK